MALGVKTGGREKGTPNKVTQDVRAAIAAFAEDRVEQFKDWIDRVAARDPAKAADLFLRAIEYHIPKLGRTELTAEGGKPLEVYVKRYSAEPVDSSGLPDAGVDSARTGLPPRSPVLASPEREGRLGPALDSDPSGAIPG